MRNFIRLTMFRGFSSTQSAEIPVYINADQIVYFNTQSRDLLRYDLPQKPNTSYVKERCTHTIISFAIGLQEESESIYVIETPEQIMEQIHA